MKNLLLNVYESYSKVPPIFFDGLLVVSITLLTFWGSVFGGDEAAKYIHAGVIFWLKNLCGGCAVTLVALQSFRSKLFAQHTAAKEERQRVEKEEETQLLKRNPTPPAPNP